MAENVAALTVKGGAPIATERQSVITPFRMWRDDFTPRGLFDDDSKLFGDHV
jgi:hypothetical protein